MSPQTASAGKYCLYMGGEIPYHRHHFDEMKYAPPRLCVSLSGYHNYDVRKCDLRQCLS
jgi:hypothetical protein